MLAGTGLHFKESAIVFQCVMVILFLFIANPIASHLLGRTAYLNKVPLFKNTTDQGQELCRLGQDDSKNLS
jgi:monovalent cation/proton antiporter MnhG/PhaG subunit